MFRLRTIATAIATTLVLAFGASSATAQDADVKIKELDFEEDRIEGELLTADGVRTKAQEERDFASLVRARASFTDKMLVDIADL